MTESLVDALATAGGRFAALATFAETAPNAQLITADGTQWFSSTLGSMESEVGAYAEGLAENRFYRGSAVSFLVGDVGGVTRAFRVADGTDGESCVVVEVEPADVPTLIPPQDPAAFAWQAVFADLEPLIPAPFYGPVSLSHFGDRCFEASCHDGSRVLRTTTVARGRSGFPFHEFEAFTASPTLAHLDAAEAVRALRGELETCGMIFAERWARLIHIDMADETAFDADPSPTGGMVFSPAAHELGDWLELSIAELAAGRGNLVVLGNRFAHDNALVSEPDDIGALRSEHPVTENPWVLWAFSRGAIQRFALLTESPA